MNRINIGGIADTEEFVVGYGLLHLSAKKYPQSFLCDFYDMTESQYWHWLNELNRANGWKHKSNFIAWYEYKYGGPKSLIGDFGLFSEYMYDEYGVQVSTSRTKIKALTLAFREEKKLKVLNEAVSLAKQHIRRVSVVYEGHPGVGLLCREILSHEYVNDVDGIELTLFNTVPFMGKFTINLHDDLVALPTHCMGHRSVKVAKNFEQAVSDCDLLIFMGNDTSTKESTNLNGDWNIKELLSLSTFWTKMGNMVDQYAGNPDMRVVFTCMKYPCFNATFFIHAARRISHDLVVAVTSHVALHALVYLSRASGIPMSHIVQRTAHVWGSPDISHVADLSNADALYNRPNVQEVLETAKNLRNEIIWDKGNPFKNMDLEDDFTWVKMEPVDLRLQNTWKYVSLEKDKVRRSSGREPYIATIRATMEILSQWYENDTSSIPVSAGICSTGGYGVPKGLVFSVPALVKREHRRGWYDFHWCYKCRILWNLDRRPRWTEETCKRPSCSENPAATQICNHHRNPDIFLPEDPFLNLDNMINTIVTVFYELDGTGELLSKILDPSDLKQFLTTSGKLKNIVEPTRPVIDDYSAKIRKELHQLREEWQNFVGKPSYLVEKLTPKAKKMDKDLRKKKKMDKLLKKKKKLEKLQQAVSEEEEEEHQEYHKDYETEEEAEQELEEEISAEEPERTYHEVHKSAAAEEVSGEDMERPRLKWRIREEQELDERIQKVIEAVTDEDIPILRLYPKIPALSEIMQNTKGGQWLNNPELWASADKYFQTFGDDRPSVKYLREYQAKRLATIEQFCKEVVPENFGHLYCLHTKEEHKKMKQDFINNRISLLPYPPPFVAEVKVNQFVPPERELGEDDATYQIRWTEAFIKYNERIDYEYSNRPPDTLYYGNHCVKVTINDDKKQNLKEESEMNGEASTGSDQLLMRNSMF